MFRRFQKRKSWLMCRGWRLTDPTPSKSVRQGPGNLRLVPASLQPTHEMRPLEMRERGRERETEAGRLREIFFLNLNAVKHSNNGGEKVAVLMANSVSEIIRGLF